MKLLSLLVISIFMTACSQNAAQNSNQTNVAAASPSPKPTVSKEEADKEAEQETAAQKTAISDFIAKNHKGWKLEGVASGGYSDECGEDTPCELDLVSGSQNKTVTVVLKRFYKSDGTSYWLVREARQIDLTKAKIEEIKQSAIENIDIVQISDEMKDAIVESRKDDFYEINTEEVVPDPRY